MSKPVASPADFLEAVLDVWVENMKNNPPTESPRPMVKKPPKTKRYLLRRNGGTVIVQELSHRYVGDRELVDFKVEKSTNPQYDSGDSLSLTIDELKYHTRLKDKS